ncbi:hypothetical protein H2201_009150 [Coniosporium apollinis]|uniref:Uncharacterized protein n=1 Tax=Coniosporium apollinis TaxID=61459 RepID=A0ABQ9NF49_9PEZI|nr:hypothetical protein H2201_009150 [Coniosporium apollinis]
MSVPLRVDDCIQARVHLLDNLLPDRPKPLSPDTAYKADKVQLYGPPQSPASSIQTRYGLVVQTEPDTVFLHGQQPASFSSRHSGYSFVQPETVYTSEAEKPFSSGAR